MGVGVEGTSGEVVSRERLAEEAMMMLLAVLAA
jgi:hypothetical protein